MPALPTDILDRVDSGYDGPLALYIHWPFCLKKCPYCDFNSHVRDSVDQASWQRAMLSELEMYGALYPQAQISAVFFGGGTPSLMPPETTAAILEAVRSLWGLEDSVEVTLEANPSSVEAERFAGYRAAGVNRVSMGIQSLRDDALKFLGRLHNSAEALSALEVAGDTFERVSFDLIYALPNQTLDAWEKELFEAITYAKGHLSLYQLTIEEGTAFYHQFHRGKFMLPDEDEAASLYDVTQKITYEAGLPAYEISNHAAAGQQSAHNLTYWRGMPFLGVGPGAHGRVPAKDKGLIATDNIRRPEDWLMAGGLGLNDSSYVTAIERVSEAVMMGLRLIDGIDLTLGKKLTGIDYTSVMSDQSLDTLEADGFITLTDERLALTPKGIPLLNTILGKLLT